MEITKTVRIVHHVDHINISFACLLDPDKEETPFHFTFKWEEVTCPECLQKRGKV